ncbi:MAG: NADP-dependent oxidoreductase [Kofleriaceae bacterium]|nr:NADP-dependent oxidoreductase [Kofleriaceae bacterium]MCL4224772.1 NADP-dependent oxidoreductase [Myxococcales bacterium]
MSTNRQVRLRRRPEGMPVDDDFELTTAARPEPGPGQVVVKNLYLSIDPTIRGWIDRDTYLPAVKPGEVVRSAGVGEVVASNHDRHRVGDRVFGLVGWQDFALLDGKAQLNPIPPGIDPRDALGVFGVTGLTAYFGLTDIGKPVAGETVVVSGAAGATGSIVGQLAKVLGCRAVGIAGGATKCRYLTEELGLDAAIDYKSEDVAARLRATCPDGIHVFFDNVGGPILDAALAHLAMRARVVVCGAISQYNDLSAAYGPKNYVNLIARRARMEGFLVLDYADRFVEGVMRLAPLVAQGKLKHRSTVVDGLAQAPAALRRLFTGDHEGKLLVKVDHPAAAAA